MASLKYQYSKPQATVAEEWLLLDNTTTVALSRVPRATGGGGGGGSQRNGNSQTGSGYGGYGNTAYGSHDTGSYGYGHGHHSGYGHHGHHKLEKCPEGIPIEQAILGIAGAAAAAFGILFRAVTQATATKRRRKRAQDAMVGGELPLIVRLQDMVWLGTNSSS